MGCYAIKVKPGQHHVETLTVLAADGVTRQNLDGLILHVRIKQDIDDPDDAPTNVDFETGDGITHLAQDGDTLGQAELILTSAFTATLEHRTYVHDGWLDDAFGDPQPIYDTSPLEVNYGVYKPA